MNLLDFHAGIEHPFFLIAGPCVIESEQLAIETCELSKERFVKSSISTLSINHLLIRLIERVQIVFVAWD